jgi:hypothetical protein
MVHEYNSTYYLRIQFILNKNHQPSLDLKSSWLAGFIDADAGFMRV